MMYIGEQIRILRLQKKISRKVLSKGLCSGQTLANIEMGNSIPDKLLEDILIQRLGKSPDKLETVLSDKAYCTEKMFCLLEELLRKGKASKAEMLLEQHYQKNGKGDKVQNMFYCRCKAYIAYRAQAAPEVALQWMERALAITLPNWKEQSWDMLLISTFEMENLLAYGRMRLEQCETKETRNMTELLWIEHFLETCRYYIEHNICDGEEQAKIFSKCAWLLARCELLGKQNEKAMQLCERALLMLREYGISYFMLPLLELLTRYGDTAEYAHFLRILKWLYANYQENRYFNDSLFHNCFHKAYYLDFELIRGERLAQGYIESQTELYPLQQWYNQLIDKKISEIGVADVLKMIRQNEFIDIGVYRAVMLLKDNPFVGDMYDGELLEKIAGFEKEILLQYVHEIEDILKVALVKNKTYEWIDEEEQRDFEKVIEKISHKISI